ncbi:hypothetical protein [Streptomyces sp. NPDC049915]|uniref:hypothetical protein n=1 Tax=Streptomyces sp. NPDC049915 TaxID=3155510 RepID=UPI00344973C6
MAPAHRRRPLVRDSAGDGRLDPWELSDSIQQAVPSAGRRPPPATVVGPADPGWFNGEVRRLYGFALPEVAYDAPTDTDLPWPGAARSHRP